MVDELLKFCDSCLGKNETIDLLTSADVVGNNVIHLLVAMNSCEVLMKNISIIKDFLSDSEQFKRILRSKGQNSCNILHYFAFHKDSLVDELLKFCDSHLGKNETIDLLISTDVFGKNVINWICEKNTKDTLIINLNIVKDYICDI